jgi:hypothetical protein
MMVSYKDIQEAVHNIWPKCDYWPTENDYLVVDLNDFVKIQQRILYPYAIPRLFECEELADLFVLQYKMQHIDTLFVFEHDTLFEPRGERMLIGDKDELYNYALGVAAGTKFEGKKKNHTVNIIYTSDGLYLYDIQTRKPWKASSNDELLKVRF